MKTKWYKKWWGIFLIIIFILFLILGIYFVYLVRKIQKSGLNNQALLIPFSVYEKNKNRKIIEGNNNYWTGSADAKIIIVEFADFLCPLCKSSFVKIRPISLKYKDKIKIIFRDFPIHENSINLAIAGRCAGEQGLFWLMHDKLFQNQEENFNSDQLTNFAKQIGADTKKFNNCLSSQKYLTSIKKDFQDGTLLEVQGTPTWFINGQKIQGDMPYGLFEEILAL